MQKTIGKYRWTICSLLFFATTINYLDRSVISLLKPYLETRFHWTESDYSHIVMAFQISYALGMLSVGRLIDKIGTKLGYTLSTLAWSLAAMGHALATSTFGFGIARAALGVSEAGNFPAAIKTTSEWFPKKERAYATGIFNSGANVGAIVAPLTVPWIAEELGWQWAFILTGAVGFIWIICWGLFYEIPSKNKKLSAGELAYINSDVVEPVEPEATEDKAQKVPWFKLLGFRQTWAFFIGKFLTDPVWWFYLFWLPAFLDAQYNVKGTDIALPVALVYTMSTIGSIAGGWLPLYLIRKGWPVFRARKTSMLIYRFLCGTCCFCAMAWFYEYVAGCIDYWSCNLCTPGMERKHFYNCI